MYTIGNIPFGPKPDQPFANLISKENFHILSEDQKQKFYLKNYIYINKTYTFCEILNQNDSVLKRVLSEVKEDSLNNSMRSLFYKKHMINPHLIQEMFDIINLEIGVRVNFKKVHIKSELKLALDDDQKINLINQFHQNQTKEIKNSIFYSNQVFKDLFDNKRPENPSYDLIAFYLSLPMVIEFITKGHVNINKYKNLRDWQSYRTSILLIDYLRDEKMNLKNSNKKSTNTNIPNFTDLFNSEMLGEKHKDIANKIRESFKDSNSKRIAFLYKILETNSLLKEKNRSKFIKSLLSEPNPSNKISDIGQYLNTNYNTKNLTKEDYEFKTIVTLLKKILPNNINYDIDF